MLDLDEMKQNGVNLTNFIAISVLEQLNILYPTEKQIKKMESLILKMICEDQCIFDHMLTRRQAECLYWAAKGKSNKETAELLSISPKTVQIHREKIIKKLNCKNITQAVFEGLKCSLRSTKLSYFIGKT